MLKNIIESIKRIFGSRKRHKETAKMVEVKKRVEKTGKSVKGGIEDRSEIIQQALSAVEKQVSVNELIEEAKKDLTGALNKILEQSGLKRLVVLDRFGKPIGVAGDGQVKSKLVDAAYTIYESLNKDADTALITSSTGSYLIIYLDDYIIVCESTTTPSDADIFMLKNDIKKVMDAVISSQEVKSKVPFLVIDDHGFVVLSNEVDKCEEVSALILQLYKFIEEHVEESVEWVKMTTDRNVTVAMKPYGNFILTFVVEADVENVDDACEEIVKELMDELKSVVSGSSSTTAVESE